ncbi:hypothetical protein SAMN05444380_11946 [Thermophagus xiamenensis]|uniref:PIN domain-containing protein n=1 Tax=Thermophagus xiamenensis TaxID=385682 RepID=A0A1I2DMF0_9BACT|nr:hypothetical protein SAMN05444380_11946 [Thermophagus xiamenensis]
MATSKMVVDTGIFIEFLRAKDKTKTQLYQIADEDISLSAITLNLSLSCSFHPYIFLANFEVIEHRNYCR